MRRQIVTIDEEKCDGCGLCVPSCAEGAIQIIDEKARLVGENLCDGLGACLGECPQGAITVEEREAEAFDEAQVEQHLTSLGRTLEPHSHDAGANDAKQGEHTMTHAEEHAHAHATGACPGAKMMTLDSPAADACAQEGTRPSQLRQWPIQLHLVPPNAPYYDGADVLLAADCVAFAIGDFHKDHLNGNSLAIACPKLDEGQDIYRQKLTAMVDEGNINTLTVMIMEVPCCYGLLQLAQDAVAQAKRTVPIKKQVVSLRGEIQSEEWC